MQIVSITGVFMTFSPERTESYYYPKSIQILGQTEKAVETA